MKTVWNAIKKVLSAFFLLLPIVLIGFVLAARMSGNVPTLFGYSVSVVVTPSMSDVLPVGSVILSREYTGEDLAEGEIITYLGATGEIKGKLVTHKIKSISEGSDGMVTLVTQGTMNASPDAPIDLSQVKTVYLCKLVNLGKVYEWFRQPYAYLVIALPIIILIAYEIWSFRRYLQLESTTQANENTAGKDRPE